MACFRFVPHRASVWWAKNHASSVTWHLFLTVPLSTERTSIKILSCSNQLKCHPFPPPHHSCRLPLVLLDSKPFVSTTHYLWFLCRAVYVHVLLLDYKLLDGKAQGIDFYLSHIINSTQYLTQLFNRYLQAWNFRTYISLKTSSLLTP